MSAYNTYPEFREWASKQTYKPDKADNPPHPPPPEPKKPDIVADLPPPSKTDVIMGMVNEVKQAKADGRIEAIVRKMQLF
jgi:hypothetical protein